MQSAVLIVFTVLTVLVGLVAFNLGWAVGFLTRQRPGPVEATLQEPARPEGTAALGGTDRSAGAPGRPAEAPYDSSRAPARYTVSPPARARQCGVCSRVRGFFFGRPR